MLQNVSLQGKGSCAKVIQSIELLTAIVFDCALLTLYFFSEKYWKSFSLMELMGNNESITWERVDSVSSMQTIVKVLRVSLSTKCQWVSFFLLKVILKANIWRLPYILDYSESQWRKKQKYLQWETSKQEEWVRKGEGRCSQLCGFQVSWCRVFTSAPVKWQLWVLDTLMRLLDKMGKQNCCQLLALSPWKSTGTNTSC